MDFQKLGHASALVLPHRAYACGLQLDCSEVFISLSPPCPKVNHPRVFFLQASLTLKL